MAISAEQLNIILAAKDREFAKAMAANTKRVEKFAADTQGNLSKAGAAFGTLANAAKAFASVAAIQQVATWVREAVDRLGDLKDAADGIGITTTALQQLQYAAQMNGVSTETLQSSLEKLSKNLGDASLGGSAAKKSLDALGLSATSLAAMPLEKALGVIADRLVTIENPMQRAALAADMFGKSGVDMINVLAGGSQGLQDMAAEAERFGVVINQDVIDNAAAAGDKLDTLSMIISANLTEALVNVGPVLIAAAQQVAAIAKAVNDFLSIDLSLPPLMNREDVKAAADEYNALRTEFDAVARAKARIASIDANYDQGIPVDLNQEAQAVQELADAEAALAKAKSDLAQKRQAEANLKDTITGIVTENNALAEQIRLQGMSTEERIRANAEKQKSAFIDKAMAEASAMTGGGIVSDAATAQILALADAHEQLYIQAEMSKVAQKGSSVGMTETQKSAAAAKEAMAAYKAMIEQTGMSFDEFNTIADSVKASMESAFMGMVDGTMSVQDAFKSMAKNIILELYRVLVVQRLVGSVATATSKGSGIMGAIGNAMGIKAAASGGAQYAGQPTVVGEHGRELFVPSSAGRVLSVPQAKAAVSGGDGVTVVQNINISTGVQQTVRNEIKSMMPQIADNAKAAVLDARRRGGSYGSAFA